MININVNNIDLFQTMLTVLPENTKGHNYYQMISLFNNNFHWLFEPLKFLGGSPDGNEPLLEGNVNYVNTSYLTLHEIIALLPDHRHLGLTQNEIMNVARLIQFYETHRFTDCINNNTRYQPVDLLTMTFTSSPAYCVMYDADYNILCSIDFIKQKFKFFNQPYNESNNIFFQTYKSLNLFFSNFTFIQNSSLNRKGWYTGLDYSKPANRLKRALHNFKKPESITQLKQRMTNIKEMEMAHFKLDYRDFLTWESYKFKYFKVVNPYFLRYKDIYFNMKRNQYLQQIKNKPSFKKNNFIFEEADAKTTHSYLTRFATETNLLYKNLAKYITTKHKTGLANDGIYTSSSLQLWEHNRVRRMHIINPTLRRTLKEIEKERLKNSLKLNLLPNNKEGLTKLWENYKEMRLNKLKIRYMSYYAKFFLGEFSLLGPKHKYREGLKEDMLTHVLSEYRNLAQNFINLLDQRFAYDKDRNVFYRNKSSIPTISDSLSYDYGFSDELNDAYASLYLFAKNLKVSAHFLNLPDLNMESYPTIPFEIHNLHNEPITRSIDNSEAIDPKGWGIKERPTQNMERIGLLGRSRKGRINMLLLKKFLKSKQFDILRNQYNDTDELTKPEYIWNLRKIKRTRYKNPKHLTFMLKNKQRAIAKHRARTKLTGSVVKDVYNIVSYKPKQKLRIMLYNLTNPPQKLYRSKKKKMNWRYNYGHDFFLDKLFKNPYKAATIRQIKKSRLTSDDRGRKRYAEFLEDKITKNILNKTKKRRRMKPKLIDVYKKPHYLAYQLRKKNNHLRQQGRWFRKFTSFINVNSQDLKAYMYWFKLSKFVKNERRKQQYQVTYFNKSHAKRSKTVRVVDWGNWDLFSTPYGSDNVPMYRVKNKYLNIYLHWCTHPGIIEYKIKRANPRLFSRRPDKGNYNSRTRNKYYNWEYSRSFNDGITPRNFQLSQGRKIFRHLLSLHSHGDNMSDIIIPRTYGNSLGFTSNLFSKYFKDHHQIYLSSTYDKWKPEKKIIPSFVRYYLFKNKYKAVDNNQLWDAFLLHKKFRPLLTNSSSIHNLKKLKELEHIIYQYVPYYWNNRHRLYAQNLDDNIVSDYTWWFLFMNLYDRRRVMKKNVPYIKFWHNYYQNESKFDNNLYQIKHSDLNNRLLNIINFDSIHHLISRFVESVPLQNNYTLKHLIEFLLLLLEQPNTPYKDKYLIKNLLSVLSQSISRSYYNLKFNPKLNTTKTIDNNLINQNLLLELTKNIDLDISTDLKELKLNNNVLNLSTTDSLSEESVHNFKNSSEDKSFLNMNQLKNTTSQNLNFYAQVTNTNLPGYISDDDAEDDDFDTIHQNTNSFIEEDTTTNSFSSLPLSAIGEYFQKSIINSKLSTSSEEYIFSLENNSTSLSDTMSSLDSYMKGFLNPHVNFKEATSDKHFKRWELNDEDKYEGDISWDNPIQKFDEPSWLSDSMFTETSEGSIQEEYNNKYDDEYFNNYFNNTPLNNTSTEFFWLPEDAVSKDSLNYSQQLSKVLNPNSLLVESTSSETNNWSSNSDELWLDGTNLTEKKLWSHNHKVNLNSASNSSLDNSSTHTDTLWSDETLDSLEDPMSDYIGQNIDNDFEPKIKHEDNISSLLQLIKDRPLRKGRGRGKPLTKYVVRNYDPVKDKYAGEPFALSDEDVFTPEKDWSRTEDSSETYFQEPVNSKFSYSDSEELVSEDLDKEYDKEINNYFETMTNVSSQDLETEENQLKRIQAEMNPNEISSEHSSGSDERLDTELNAEFDEMEAEIKKTLFFWKHEDEKPAPKKKPFDWSQFKSSEDSSSIISSTESSTDSEDSILGEYIKRPVFDIYDHPRQYNGSWKYNTHLMESIVGNILREKRFSEIKAAKVNNMDINFLENLRETPYTFKPVFKDTSNLLMGFDAGYDSLYFTAIDYIQYLKLISNVFPDAKNQSTATYKDMTMGGSSDLLKWAEVAYPENYTPILPHINYLSLLKILGLVHTQKVLIPLKLAKKNFLPWELNLTEKAAASWSPWYEDKRLGIFMDKDTNHYFLDVWPSTIEDIFTMRMRYSEVVDPWISRNKLDDILATKVTNTIQDKLTQNKDFKVDAKALSHVLNLNLENKKDISYFLTKYHIDYHKKLKAIYETPQDPFEEDPRNPIPFDKIDIFAAEKELPKTAEELKTSNISKYIAYQIQLLDPDYFVRANKIKENMNFDSLIESCLFQTKIADKFLMDNFNTPEYLFNYFNSLKEIKDEQSFLTLLKNGVNKKKLDELTQTWNWFYNIYLEQQKSTLFIKPFIHEIPFSLREKNNLKTLNYSTFTTYMLNLFVRSHRTLEEAIESVKNDLDDGPGNYSKFMRYGDLYDEPFDVLVHKKLYFRTFSNIHNLYLRDLRPETYPNKLYTTLALNKLSTTNLFQKDLLWINFFHNLSKLKHNLWSTFAQRKLDTTNKPYLTNTIYFDESINPNWKAFIPKKYITPELLKFSADYFTWHQFDLIEHLVIYYQGMQTKRLLKNLYYYEKTPKFGLNFLNKKLGRERTLFFGADHEKVETKLFKNFDLKNQKIPMLDLIDNNIRGQKRSSISHGLFESFTLPSLTQLPNSVQDLFSQNISPSHKKYFSYDDETPALFKINTSYINLQKLYKVLVQDLEHLTLEEKSLFLKVIFSKINDEKIYNDITMLIANPLDFKLWLTICLEKVADNQLDFNLSTDSSLFNLKN